MHLRCLSASTTILLLVASLTFAGCSFTEAEEGPPPVVLRTYRVPVEHQGEMYGALRNALGEFTENPFGRVSQGPGGTLIVAAPERIQEGVEQIVNADLGTPPAEADAGTIRLTYSIVAGRPAASTTQPFSVRGRSSPRLDSVLAQIAEAQGPTEFAVLEEISVVSTGQAQARVGGRVVMVNQQASRRGDRIVAQVEIQRLRDTNSLNTQIFLRDGQVLVLGQAGESGLPGTPPAFPDARSNDTPATLYYVVAADSL